MLIDTKLHMPKLKPGLLERNHLLDRLNSDNDRSLVLISGPAGSGKTSLLCQWIVKENFRTAWYSIDEKDNDPEVFFKYFLTTLANVEDRLKAPIRTLLVDGKKMPLDSLWANFMAKTCNI